MRNRGAFLILWGLVACDQPSSSPNTTPPEAPVPEATPPSASGAPEAEPPPVEDNETPSTGQGFGSSEDHVPAPVPQPAVLGKRKVEGQLSDDVVRRILEQNLRDVRHCQDEGARRDPNMSGEVLVAFTIAIDGELVDIEVRRHPGGDAGQALATCLAPRVRSWSFPKGQDGKPVKVLQQYVIERAPPG